MAIRLDSRRGDLVFRAAVALPQYPIHAVLAPDFADGRDSMPHPELVQVFRGNAGDWSYVRVHIVQAGQNIHSRQIHFARAGLLFWRFLSARGAAYRDNLVLLDHDIHRPHGRRSCAVNQRYVLKDQSRIWAFTFGAWRSFLHWLGRILRYCESGKQRVGDEDANGKIQYGLLIHLWSS